MKNKHKNKNSAFTLIELLIVISVIAALLAIMIPVLAKARSAAKKVKCAHNLKQIHLAFDLYTQNNDYAYPCAQDPVLTKPKHIWLWMGRGWRSFVEPYLAAEKAPKNARILLCPEDNTDPNKYDDTSYAYSMSFYHSPAQINSTTNVAQQYDSSTVKSSIPQKTVDVKTPQAKILAGEWLSNHKKIKPDNGWWDKNGTGNYLFADGHINYLPAKKLNTSNDSLKNPNLTKNGIKGCDYPPSE